MNYKKFLHYKLDIEDAIIPDNYSFSTVEKFLDKINENKKNETWKETGIRLKNNYPKISKYLLDAYNNFYN